MVVRNSKSSGTSHKRKTEDVGNRNRDSIAGTAGNLIHSAAIELCVE